VISHAVVSCALMILTCPQHSNPIIQPFSIVSPSGSRVLTVAPSNRYGLGAAAYRMQTSTDTLWGQTLDFTLVDAAVDDTGTCVGYGYTQGYAMPGALILARIDADGSVGYLDHVVRRYEAIRDAPPEPRGIGVVIVPEANVMILRLSSRPDGEWWRVSSVSDIDDCKEFSVASFCGTKDVRNLDFAKAVPTTTLVVAGWTTSNPANCARTIAVFDVERQTPVLIWRTDNSPSPSTGTLVTTPPMPATCSIRCSAGPGAAFSLESAAEARRTSYACERRSDGWHIGEPHVESIQVVRGASSVADTEHEFPAVQVPPGSSVQLTDCKRIAVTTVIDNELLVADVGQRLLRVFDARGEQASTVSLPPGLTGSSLAWLRVNDNRRITIGADSGLFELQADASWSRTALYRHLLQASTPGTSDYWATTDIGLLRCDSVHKSKLNIEKASDGRWLERTGAIAVNERGQVALIERRYGNEARRYTRVLHTFDVSGDPRNTIALPHDVVPLCVAYQGTTLAVGAEGRLLIMCSCGAAVGRLPVEGRPVALFPVAACAELWVVTTDCRFTKYAWDFESAAAHAAHK